jgi:hypothetical protein
MTRNHEWRHMRMRALVRMQSSGWRFGSDPRRKGSCLVSPRGTIYEFRVAPGGCAVRRYVERTVTE